MFYACVKSRPTLLRLTQRIMQVWTSLKFSWSAQWEHLFIKYRYGQSLPICVTENIIWKTLTEHSQAHYLLGISGKQRGGDQDLKAKLKMSCIGPLFLSFSSFQYSWKSTNIQYKFSRWLDLNCGPLYQLSHNHCPSNQSIRTTDGKANVAHITGCT